MRDIDDTFLIAKFILERNSFDGCLLKNISSGEVASIHVNVDDSKY